MRTSFKQLKIGSVFPKFKCLQSIRQLPYLSYHLVIIPAKSAMLTLEQCLATGAENQKSYTLKLSYMTNEALNSQNYEKQQNQQTSNNKDQSFPKNLMEIINTPLFIFLFIFSSTITMPRIKLVKSAFKQLLDQLDLPCKWQKSNSNYSAHIVVRGQQKYPCISYRDLKDIEQFGHKFENNEFSTQNRRNNLQYLLNQIKEIKCKNAFKFCEQYFQTKLIVQLLEKHQSQIQQQYQHILEVIQQNYQDMSCTQRINTSDNYIHSLTEMINPLGRTSNSSQNQRVRRTCSIIQVPNALISIQKSDYSLKALKQSIRNRLVKQNKNNFDKNSAISINSDTNKGDIDEQQKKVVHDLIQDLFTSEYEEIWRQLKQSNRQVPLSIQMEIYKKVVQKMKSYIQMDYKCLDLIHIIFKHILETSNLDKFNPKEEVVMNLNEIMEQLQTEPHQESLSSPSIQVKCSQNNDLVVGLCQHIQYLEHLLSLHKIEHNSLKLESQKSDLSKQPKFQVKSAKILVQKTNNIQIMQGNPQKQVIKRQKYIQNKIEQIKRQQKMKINKIEGLKSERHIEKNNSSKQLIISQRNTRKLILNNSDQIENKEIQNVGSKSNRFDDKNKSKNMGRIKGWNSSTSSNNRSIKNNKSSTKEL